MLFTQYLLDPRRRAPPWTRTRCTRPLHPERGRARLLIPTRTRRSAAWRRWRPALQHPRVLSKRNWRTGSGCPCRHPPPPPPPATACVASDQNSVDSQTHAHSAVHINEHRQQGTTLYQVKDQSALIVRRHLFT